MIEMELTNKAGALENARKELKNLSIDEDKESNYGELNYNRGLLAIYASFLVHHFYNNVMYKLSNSQVLYTLSLDLWLLLNT